MVIYADVLFAINLVVNYLALLVSAKLCAYPAKRLRLLAAAAIGALYAVLSVLREAEFLLSPAVKLAAGVLLSLCAFAGYTKLLRITLVFFALCALFGGAVFALSLLGGGMAGGALFTPVTLRLLAVSFALTYAVLTLVFKRAAARRRSIVISEIALRGKTVTLRALEDSGNQLREPLSGRAVMVAEREKLLPLFPPEIRRILAEEGDVTSQFTALRALGFRLVPYSAVGTQSGLLLAFLPDSLSVNGEKRGETLVALSPARIGGAEYSAVINV